MSAMMLARARSDAQLQADVQRELRWDSSVHQSNVGVLVHDGVVTLAGWVASYGEKIAAGTAAHRVAGVLDVANELEVRLPGLRQRSDEEIAHAVRDALAWDVMIPADQIHSTVSSGWITLTGNVSLWRLRHDAERSVRNLMGVKGVTNQIGVVPAVVDREHVRDEIRAALERQADVEVSRIHVNLDNGSLVLSGTVRSWAEKTAAVGAASHTPGATVVDKLVVNAFA